MTPFSPVGTTGTVTASGTSQPITLDANTTAETCRVVVSGTGIVAIRFGAAATTAYTPMLGNTVETFDRGGATTLNVIAISGTPVVYATCGIGGL